MRKNRKPIRKCHGCELNRRTHCAHYEFPFEMWLSVPCPGYNNQDLIAKVHEQTQEALTSRQRRRSQAEARAHTRKRRTPRQRGRYGGAIGR